MLAKKLQAAAKAVEPVFIEDTFAVHLYTGNGSTQTITNGIDLAGKGGLVWIKNRAISESHLLKDTARGSLTLLSTDSTAAEIQNNYGVAYGGFNSNGFTAIGDTYNYASWTFRKQPKFFDVVTGTGPGVFSHNLGSVPGCIIFKRTNVVDQWRVAHNGLTGGITGNFQLALNTTAAESNSFSNFSPTSTTINTTSFAKSGNTWVAYLFAHNAGGFGLTGTDNVISCGSYASSGGATVPVNLGYEPQWMLIKNISQATNWQIVDNMRGFPAQAASTVYQYALYPNLSDAENTIVEVTPTATGFNCVGSGIDNYIYIAIRRGPMKVPMDATKVFSPVTYTGNSSSPRDISTGFPVDAFININRNKTSNTNNFMASRLTGNNRFVFTNTAGTETDYGTGVSFGTSAANSGITLAGTLLNASSATFIQHNFRRAPGFFDVVCYTGNGGSNTVSHSLGTTPQMAIVKSRSAASSAGWFVNVPLAGTNNVGYLNLTNSFANSGAMSMNSTSFSYTAGLADLNASGTTYVAYLFASCPGVSKVTNFTGTGALQTINCGFTSGARFALIKRTDAAGDWYIWDSARGISSASDPYLLLNSTAAEVTTTNWVDTTSTGFQVTAASGNNVNINGASYIVLAIA